jgi:hypothetical protein
MFNFNNKLNPVDQTLYLLYQETWFLWYIYFENSTDVFCVHPNA